MDKILFFFCNLIAVIGICILFITTILIEVVPMMGRVAFQAAMAGSYSPSDYTINFTVINLFAIILILVGVITGYKIYKRADILSK
ncbi:hypothetical protein GCM10011351_32060 [Paraliobacillus quinghaiensis]|uniref:Uncharacterized protein n=1 Tax=Paraliobacillus quinghaiensis TaxID=470815 RepID=A0A917WZL7_9BACI|nr:hypothetical protein [Paraliobacillus quinghaiensis]GGM43665.1 hypothetical protein GCM10011351_32060 [Paraliobacillus quinghaiensis]